MQIAFISQYFHPEQFSNNAIAKNLVLRGHQVHAITCVPNYPAGRFFEGYSNSRNREETWEGISIHRVRTIPRGESALSLIANYLIFPLAASWTLFRRLRERPDVSFVSMPSPLLQALAGIILRWRLGVPCVYWVQDIWPESATYTLNLHNPLLVRPLTWFCGWLYRRADLVLVQSDAFPKIITAFGVPRERIRVLPNTAPDQYRSLTPDQAPAEAQLVPQDGFRLMFAGNIGESQDFDTLVGAAERLRARENLKWVIIGSGRDLARVRRVVRERGLELRFHFLGRHPEERMPYFFAHADAMLVSLKNVPIFSLTVPYKIQCYMACGKPIIASLNGEGARVIHDSQAGIAVEAGAPEKLALAITKMADSPDEIRARYAQNARTFFDLHYAAETIYGNLEAWLREVALRE